MSNYSFPIVEKKALLMYFWIFQVVLIILSVFLSCLPYFGTLKWYIGFNAPIFGSIAGTLILEITILSFIIKTYNKIGFIAFNPNSIELSISKKSQNEENIKILLQDIQSLDIRYGSYRRIVTHGISTTFYYDQGNNNHIKIKTKYNEYNFDFLLSDVSDYSALLSIVKDYKNRKINIKLIE